MSVAEQRYWIVVLSMVVPLLSLLTVTASEDAGKDFYSLRNFTKDRNYVVNPDDMHNIILHVLARRCNGQQAYCDLSFNQFTFPGTHSSGSGFDGSLRRCTNRDEEEDCIWRNQNLNITAQLQLGIRFLTIDTCILPDHCITDIYNGDIDQSRLLTCQGGEDEVPFGGYRYGGLVSQVLGQISEWMDREENRNEVIGLQFTNNSPESNKSRIVRELIRLLEERWCPNSSDSETCRTSVNDVTLNTYYNQSNSWPTLSQAIDNNSRIFVFMEEGLNVNQLETVWMNPAPVSKYTFTGPPSTSNECSRLIECAQQCNTSSKLFSATGYLLGICNTDVQQDCNPRLADYAEECYRMRQQYNQTVNVILVNYPEQAVFPNTVFEVAKILNERNIDKYLHVQTTTMYTVRSIITTTSVTGSGENCVMFSHNNIITCILLTVLGVMLY